MDHVDRVVQAVVIRAFGQPSVTAESDTEPNKKSLTGKQEISNTTAKNSTSASFSIDLSDPDEFPALGFTISPSKPSSFPLLTTTPKPQLSVKPKRRIKPTLKKFADSSPPPSELKKKEEQQPGPEVISIAEDFCTAISKGHIGTTPIGTALAALFRLFVSPPDNGMANPRPATNMNTIHDLTSILRSRADCLLFADLLSGLSKAAEMEELLQADLRLCEALRRASASAASEEPVPPPTCNSMEGSGGMTFEHPSHPLPQVETNRQQALDLFASAMRDNSRGEGFGRRLKERNDAIRSVANKLLGMLMPCNYRWFARYFTAQLMGSADPISPTDEDEVLLRNLMGGDKKRLGYLKQRILGGRADDSGRQGTTINEDEEENHGPLHFFQVFLSGADSGTFNAHLRSELHRKLELDWNSRAAQHSLPQWLSRLCISSRFIGQLCFGPNFEADESDCLPEWPPGALPLIRFLSEARQDGTVAMFVPWASEHLRMANRDPAAKNSIEFHTITKQLLMESKIGIDSPASLLVACEVQGLLWQELGVNYEIGDLPRDEDLLLLSPVWHTRHHAIGPAVYISKSLSKSCCPHLDKMHKALLCTPSSPSLDTALANPSSTEQNQGNRISPSSTVPAPNQTSGSSEALSRSAEQRALADSFFTVHPLLHHTAEVILREASCHRDPSVVGQAVRLLAPPTAHPRAVEVAAVLTERHCRLENDQHSSLRILSKNGIRPKDRGRGSPDIFDQYDGNPLALEEAILAQPPSQWRAAREKLKLRSGLSTSSTNHPLCFSRLDAALAAQERCTTTTTTTGYGKKSCVSTNSEQREDDDDERK